jgi:hypothetical protein
MTEIKIIFLLAYDFELVKLSLPCVYNHADKILFSIDINRTSFAGNKYYFDENFINWIKEYDTESKITIYEDNFYQSNLTVMECETRQRQMSADYLGEGGWTIQLDVDEYFINFKSFVTFLETKSNYLIDPKNNRIAISSNWIVMYKQDENGFFMIKDSKFPLKIATNYPKYTIARNLHCKSIYTRSFMLHQSWARSIEEIETKVKNWSHASDIKNPTEYLEFYKSINIENYKSVIDFAPLKPKSIFKRLDYIPIKNANELITYFEKIDPKESSFYIFRKNFIQWFLNVNILKTIYFKINNFLYWLTYDGKNK